MVLTGSSWYSADARGPTGLRTYSLVQKSLVEDGRPAQAISKVIFDGGLNRLSGVLETGTYDLVAMMTVAALVASARQQHVSQPNESQSKWMPKWMRK